jgi:NTE family protein
VAYVGTDSQLNALRDALPRLFSNVDEATFAAIRPHLVWQWVEIPGGAVLLREGDPTDALYVLVSGRLRASVRAADGADHIVGEIARGETVGEMGIVTGEPRRATITALRDSLLARFDLATIRVILHEFPGLALNLSRVIIERLQRRNDSQKPVRNLTNIAVVPISDRVDAAAVVQQLTRHLQKQGQNVFHISAGTIDAKSGRAIGLQANDGAPEANHWLVSYLDVLEARYSLVLYQAEFDATTWTQRCLRQADEVLLVGRAAASPELSPVERRCLSGVEPLNQVRHTLLLLHEAGEWATGTTQFLAKRPAVTRHYHVRSGNEKDVARLSRFLGGNAVGLVLSGGGARGLAHIGAFRAIEEAGIPVDVIGGTSIGSVLGACYACYGSWQRVIEETRSAFLSNPTSDFNLLPLVSLLAGRKLDRIVSERCRGHQVEELWIPFFCVSSNYTRACEVVHTRGDLRRALLASMAIPGIFPPVVSGNDLLVDGAVFNNMPVDVMARREVRTILAVDLRPEEKQPQPFGFDELPGTWALLVDRLKPASERRYHVPSILNSLVEASSLNSHQKRASVLGDVDLLFKPDVRRFGLLDWRSYDQLVEEGYRSASRVLAARSNVGRL